MINSSAELYQLETVFPFTNNSSSIDLHSLIVHDQVQSNLSKIRKLSINDLNAKKSKYLLTPLHLAVIKGNVEFVKFLINKKVSLTVQDVHKWTPLHHSVVQGFCHEDRSIENLLVAQREVINGLNMENDLGQSFLDLARLLNNKPEPLNKKVFYYESNGEILEGTAKDFKEMTGITFTAKNLITPKNMIKKWASTNPSIHTQKEYKFELLLRDQYLEEFCSTPERAGKQPKVYVKKINDLIRFGLFAAEDIEPNKIITAYTGEWYEFCKQDTSYRIDDLETKNFGNIGCFINDGFPNSSFFPIPNVQGNPSLPVTVATRKILKGEQIFVNYLNNHSAKKNKYIELNPHEATEYFSKAKNDTYSKLGTLYLQLQLSQKLFCKNNGIEQLKTKARDDKFNYLFDTLPLLIRIITDNIISVRELVKLYNVSQFYDDLDDKGKSLFNFLKFLEKTANESPTSYQKLCAFLKTIVEEFTVETCYFILCNLDLSIENWEVKSLQILKVGIVRDYCFTALKAIDESNCLETVLGIKLSLDKIKHAEVRAFIVEQVLNHLYQYSKHLVTEEFLKILGV